MYAKNPVPLYDGDGYLHAGPAPSGKSGDVPPVWKDAVEIEREAHRLRGEAMAELFGKLRAWLRTKLARARTRALEDYLSRASSLADVERRLREAEREGRFFTG